MRHLPASALRLAFGALAVSAFASTSTAQQTTQGPNPDPRIGLHPGWFNAEQTQWNMRLVSTTAPSDSFLNRNSPGDFAYLNSDISFVGNYVLQGNFAGYQVWDVSNPARPRLHRAFVCPGSQSDVSVWRNLAFVSGEALNGRTDCGTQGVPDTVSHDRLRGIRIFDITDIANPRLITQVQTCRGSHTHTVVNSPSDTTNVYVYISGSAPVRSPNELAGCSALAPEEDPNSALFRIEVIRVPLAHPEQAAVVASPRIFQDLAPVTSHGDAPEDIANASREAAAARARGAYTGVVQGREIVLPQNFVQPLLDSVVRARSGTGPATAADSAALRTAMPALVERAVNGPPGARNRPRRGPSQCHDITVYPAINRAGGACGGYGLLLDITDPTRPRRIGAAADSNFSFWHSATFNNDGTKVLFSDEWGGGLQPRCRASDKPEWGADALFTLVRDTMTFRSYYKMPAAQTANENCVAHNGSLIPVPGRDIMSQGWYQGGVSVFDWTDASHPMEIAFFDRGPMDSTRLQAGGSWSAYWYNGLIYSSDLSRGLDIFELQPSPLLSQNEIDAAKLVHFDYLNVQDQQRFVWPASFVVARAYLDQLERGQGLSASRIASTRQALARAERQSGRQRSTSLTQLASQLEGQAAGDQAKVRMVVGVVRELAR